MYLWTITTEELFDYLWLPIPASSASASLMEDQMATQTQILKEFRPTLDNIIEIKGSPHALWQDLHKTPSPSWNIE